MDVLLWEVEHTYIHTYVYTHAHSTVNRVWDSKFSVLCSLT